MDWMFGLLAVLLAAAPPPTPAEISAPLGHLGNVVDVPPTGGTSETDRVLLPSWEGCDRQGIYVMRFMGGSARVLEQLQQSLDRSPGSEKRLFARKVVLGEVMRQLSESRLEEKVPCTPSKLLEGAQLDVTAAPKKWCERAPSEEGELWFFSKKRPAAVFSVQPGAPDRCKPRFSVVLFDASGSARVQLHADWGGVVKVSVLGDRCQRVDYDFDASRQVFKPTWKTCKR